MRKIIKACHLLSLIDLVRKLIYVIRRELNFNLLKKIKSYYHFKSINIKIGKRVIISGQSYNLKIGKGVSLFPDCKFELAQNSYLSIGNNTLFSYGVIISCYNHIEIGDNTQIGEYSSLRDTTHDYNNYGIPMIENKDIVDKIIIGNDVWIGRNCLILPNAKVGDGVVIGANSIVKGILEENSVYAGSPLRLIKKRN